MTALLPPNWPSRMVSAILSSLISGALTLALFSAVNSGTPTRGGNRDAGQGTLVVLDLAPPVPASNRAAGRVTDAIPRRHSVPQDHTPATGSIPSRHSHLPPSTSLVGAQASLESGEMVVAGAAANLPPAELFRYQAALEDHLARYRTYPADAKAAGQQGVVAVHFLIGRDGSVRGAWIEESSGISSLDREAIDAVLRAQPLPALPAGWPDQLDITLPVTFRLG